MRRILTTLLILTLCLSFPFAAVAATSAADYKTVDIRIKILDEDGNPVPNLCVNLEWISGKEGPYMAGDAVTKSGGSVIRSVTPGATYAAVVTDRDQLDYDGKTQRNQVPYKLEVKASATSTGVTEFKLLWDKKTPRELDIAAKDKVTFTFVDQDGKPVEDLWVCLIPQSDTGAEPRQILPGITDKEGKSYWTLPEYAKFDMAAVLFSDERESSMKAVEYTVTVKKDKTEYKFTWDPK